MIKQNVEVACDFQDCEMSLSFAQGEKQIYEELEARSWATWNSGGSTVQLCPKHRALLQARSGR